MQERYTRFESRKSVIKDMQCVGPERGQEKSSVFVSRTRDRNILGFKEAGIEYGIFSVRRPACRINETNT